MSYFYHWPSVSKLKNQNRCQRLQCCARARGSFAMAYALNITCTKTWGIKELSCEVWTHHISEIRQIQLKKLNYQGCLRSKGPSVKSSSGIMELAQPRISPLLKAFSSPEPASFSYSDLKYSSQEPAVIPKKPQSPTSNFGCDPNQCAETRRRPCMLTMGISILWYDTAAQWQGERPSWSDAPRQQCCGHRAQ